MKKWNLLALAVATVCLPSISAFAEDAVLIPGNGPEPKEGVSLRELSALTKDLQIRLDGRRLVVAGLIPERCVDKARLEYNEGRDNQHVVMIRLSEQCEKKDFKANPNESRVSLSKILGSLQLADVSGKVFLRSLNEADAESDSRQTNEPLINAKDKQQLAVKSSADTESEERKAREDRLAVELKRQQAEMQAKVDGYCKEGNTADISLLAAQAAQLGLDISLAIQTSSDNKIQLIKNSLAKAKTAEQAKKVFEEFQAAAERGEIGVEADVLNGAYVAKRISLLRARVEDVKADAEAKVNVVAAEINEFKNELNELDRDLFKARKADFADLYAKMGDALHERKDHERAADMFARGRDIDNRANARKWEQAIAKTLMDAAEACVKKNPDLKKSEKCNKLAERSKTAADRAKEQLASAAEKDEGAAEEMEDFMTSYNEMYGAGPKYYQMGFGWMHPYAPSKIEQLRVQGYQNYMMEQQQKMMQKMYGSYFGMGMNGMMSGMGMPGGGALY